MCVRYCINSFIIQIEKELLLSTRRAIVQIVWTCTLCVSCTFFFYVCRTNGGRSSPSAYVFERAKKQMRTTHTFFFFPSYRIQTHINTASKTAWSSRRTFTKTSMFTPFALITVPLEPSSNPFRTNFAN